MEGSLRKLVLGVVTKVRKSLAGWKQKVLSKVARSLLIPTRTATIPIYSMQSTKLPCSTIDELERINRDFFWGSSPDSKRLHTMNWESIWTPRTHIGIKWLRHMNHSMLAKLAWRILAMLKLTYGLGCYGRNMGAFWRNKREVNKCLRHGEVFSSEVS